MKRETKISIRHIYTIVPPCVAEIEDTCSYVMLHTWLRIFACPESTILVPSSVQPARNIKSNDCNAFMGQALTFTQQPVSVLEEFFSQYIVKFSGL